MAANRCVFLQNVKLKIRIKNEQIEKSAAIGWKRADGEHAAQRIKIQFRIFYLSA